MWSRVAALAALVTFVGCGTGGVHVDPIFRGVVGANGGTVAAGPVTLVLPPGALAGDTVIEILPQPTPLPMDPLAGTVQQLDLHCIGPVGLDLQQLSLVRFCYDLSIIPPGFTQADLVLLIWDDAAGFFRIEASATHDVVGQCFEFTSYDELGHIGLGVPTGGPPVIPFNFFFFGGPQVGGLVRPQGDPPFNPLLTLADSAGAVSPVGMDGTEDANLWVPSRDGSRIAFEQFFQNETSALMSVDVAASGPFSPRLLRDNNEYTSDDGLWGWLGTQDRVFFEYYPVVDMAVGTDTVQFAAVPGGGGPHVDLRGRSESAQLYDVRVSPDQTMVLLKWLLFEKAFGFGIDIIDSTTGALIGEDILTTFEFNEQTPRWLPDSSGIYFIEQDGRQSVTRMDPDGSNASTLYTLPVINSYIKDFVVATPFDGTPPECAYIRHDYGDPGDGGEVEVEGSIDPIDPTDYYVFDRLDGTAYADSELGGEFNVVEMVPAYSDGFGTSRVLLQLSTEFVFTDGGLAQPPDGRTLVFLGASLAHDFRTPLSHVDLQHSTGQFLVTMENDDFSDPDFPTRGIYECDTFGDGPVDVTPEGYDFQGPARWLRSWRHTPGIFTSLVR